MSSTDNDKHKFSFNINKKSNDECECINRVLNLGQSLMRNLPRRGLLQRQARGTCGKSVNGPPDLAQEGEEELAVDAGNGTKQWSGHGRGNNRGGRV